MDNAQLGSAALDKTAHSNIVRPVQRRLELREVLQTSYTWSYNATPSCSQALLEDSHIFGSVWPDATAEFLLSVYI